ncbi:MAG: hypothetical protein ACP5I1_15395, partial [Candidatus Hinthialibacter sp.]
MRRFFSCFCLSVTFVLVFCIADAVWAAVPKEYDLVCMESGNIIEGSILIETRQLITLETLGGSVSVPMQ